VETKKAIAMWSLEVRERLAMFGWATSLFLVAFYLRFISEASLPEFPLWILLLSLGVTVSSVGIRPHRAIFGPVLFVTSFCLMNIYWLRFGAILGSDLIREYDVAYIATRQGLTDSLIANRRYASTLSMTLLPAMVTQVTGIDTLDLFRWLFPFVIALVPLALFLFLRQIIGAELAALSSIIYAFDYTTLTLGPLLYREGVAKLLALLWLWSLVRLYKRSERGHFLLSVVLMMGFVTAHYTASYFFSAVIVLLLVLPSLWKRVFRSSSQKSLQIVSKRVVVLEVVIATLWSMSLALGIFESTVKFQIVPILGQILTLSLSREGHFGLVDYVSYGRGNVFTSLVNLVYYALIVVGFLRTFNRRANSWHLGLTTWGGFCLLILFLYIVVPPIQRVIYPDRPYSYGLFVFAYFIATTLLQNPPMKGSNGPESRSVGSKARSICLGTRQTRQVIAVLVVALFLVSHVAVMPRIYFTSASAVPKQEQVVILKYDSYHFSFGRWLANYAVDDLPFVSDDGESFHVIHFIANIGKDLDEAPSYVNWLVPDTLRGVVAGQRAYVITADYTTKDGYLVVRWWNLSPNMSIAYHIPTDFDVVSVDPVKIRALLFDNSRSNLVYDNARFMLASVGSEED